MLVIARSAATRQSRAVSSSKHLVLLPIAMLAAPGCRNEERPPAPTAEESAQLNDAENMLNAMEEGRASEGATPTT